MSRKDKKEWSLDTLLSVIGFIFELVRVVVDALPAVAGQNAEEQRIRLRRKGFVHQAVCRAAKEFPASPHDIERDQQGQHRIEPQPARNRHGCKASDHADGSPHIAHQVARVRFQG